MRHHPMRMNPVWALLVGLGLVAACTNPTDIEEIKTNQKRILQKLAVLEKKVGRSAPGKKKPKRPKIDYDKVHKIRTEGVAFKGAKDAKVTLVEYTDYQ